MEGTRESFTHAVFWEALAGGTYGEIDKADAGPEIREPLLTVD